MEEKPQASSHNRFKPARTYCVNDCVVYPGHGVAKISRILERNVGRNTTSFYELKFLSKEMTVLVPVNNLPSVGVRPLSSIKCVHDVIKVLEMPARKISPYELTASNWNKRNKEYQSKIRNGDLMDISEIYRDLKSISKQKELSFGEKNLLQQTENLLVEEISIIEKVDCEVAIELLRSTLNKKNASADAVI